MRLALLALALAGCTVPAPEGQKRDTFQAPPRPRLPDASILPDLAPPPLAEVEVRGRVDARGAPAGKLFVVLTDGPCFQPGSHYVGTMPTKVGFPYFVEVFPPQGTKLDVCAALVVGDQRTTPWHGRARKAPLLAVGSGEVEFEGVDVKIARQKTPVIVPPALVIE